MNRLCTAIIAASLLLVGCGAPEDAFVGKYDGTAEFPQEFMDMLRDSAVQADQDPDEILAQMNEGAPTLELKDDGTFEQSNLMGLERMTTKGKWALSEDGKTITFSDYEVIEENKGTYWEHGIYGNEGQKFDVSDDGKSFSYLDTTGGMSVTTTFTRD